VSRIDVGELGRHASRYVAEANAGEVVEVLEHGRVLALLIAATPVITAEERPVGTARLVAGTGELFVPPRRRTAPRGASASDVLTELRADRLA
jgi:antitoxin (DNA-binding transcriptional repressor) of toxin-antitoxin stability system